MKRDVKHQTDGSVHADARRSRKTAGHKIDRREYLFQLEEDSDGEGKIKKKYNRNEQKRMNSY